MSATESVMATQPRDMGLEQIQHIHGFSTLLIGPGGAGKTTALKTLADAGLEVFVLFTEKGMEVIGDDPRIKWAYVPPAVTSWRTLIENAKQINVLTNEALQKMARGLERDKYTQFIDMLNMMANFRDQYGIEHGDVMTWNTDRVFAIDSLTGLSTASKNLTVGAKPVITQPDWGTMMDNLERLITTLTYGLHCHFVLTAHIEREHDEITQGTKVTASTLGRKLAPKLPGHFSHVIRAIKTGDKFTWSNMDIETDLKSRGIPFSNNLPPDFGPLVKVWLKEGGKIEKTGAK